MTDVKPKVPTRTSRGTHEIKDYISDSDLHELAAKLFWEYGTDLFAYTDGSCWNSDPDRCGGSAYAVFDNYGRVIKAMHKGFVHTSSNRMEILAIISAIASVPQDESITVFTDSEYAINTFEYGGQKNTDLIAMYHKYADRLSHVGLYHVRGHEGNPLNEWCDYWSNWEYKTVRENLQNKTI